MARQLTGRDDAESVVQVLARTPRDCTAVTCGEEGCWFTDESGAGVSHQPAFETEVVDTTGCGDAFHGAYVASIIRGGSVAASIRFASAAAAINATTVGAQAGLPRRDQVERLLRGGMEVQLSDKALRAACQ